MSGTHDLVANPADDLRAKWVDALTALQTLEHAALNIACPECDPSGERAASVAVTLHEEYDVDFINCDMLLAQVADVRDALKPVVLHPSCCGHDEDGEEVDG